MLAFDPDCDFVTAVTPLHVVTETDAQRFELRRSPVIAVSVEAGSGRKRRPTYVDHSHPAALWQPSWSQPPSCRFNGHGEIA